MASTIWLIFCAVSVEEREGLASFGDGGELVGGSAVGGGGEDVVSVVETGVGEAVGVGAVASAECPNN